MKDLTQLLEVKSQLSTQEMTQIKGGGRDVRSGSTSGISSTGIVIKK